MRLMFGRSVLLMILVLMGGSAFAGVEVFAAAHIPLANVPEHAVVTELDALAGLDSFISQDLPGDDREAAQLMLQRMRSSEWQQLHSRYQQAATGMTRAWMLGVEKLPAVVIDGYVVYGEPNVGVAIELIEEAQHGQ